MSNASQALIMAAGIVISVLILSLVVTLFASSKSLTRSYDDAKQSEAVQQYNSAFTKYIGNDLTIHEVMTIRNLAISKNIDFDIPEDINISQIINDYKPGDPNSIQKYRLLVEFDGSSGYIKKLKIEEK